MSSLKIRLYLENGMRAVIKSNKQVHELDCPYVILLQKRVLSLFYKTVYEEGLDCEPYHLLRKGFLEMKVKNCLYAFLGTKKVLEDMAVSIFDRRRLNV